MLGFFDPAASMFLHQYRGKRGYLGDGFILNSKTQTRKVHLRLNPGGRDLRRGYGECGAEAETPSFEEARASWETWNRFLRSQSRLPIPSFQLESFGWPQRSA